MKRSLVIVLVLAMMFGVLAACAAQPEAPAAPAPTEPAPAPAEPTPAPTEMPEPVEPGVEEVAVVERENITMAFLFKDSTTPFWRYMWAGAVDAGERYGVTVVEFSPMQQQNHEEQVRHMEDVIMLDFDVIMLAAIDTTAIIPSIYQVVEAGIPVITANTRVDGGPVETFIGLNNYEGALILSQNMMELLGGEGTVVIVDGNPASTTSNQRLQGLMDGAADFPDVEIIVTAPGYFNRANAMAIMENMIQAVPRIDAVMAMNDEMALGSVQALNAAGIFDVYVSGFDGALEGLEAITDGIMTFSLDQDPIALGYYSVVYALEVLAAIDAGAQIGGFVLDEWIIVGGTLCGPDNAPALVQRYRDFGF